LDLHGRERLVLLGAVTEDGVTLATDALSATGEEAVTSVEADGAGGGLRGGGDGGGRATLTAAGAEETLLDTLATSKDAVKVVEADGALGGNKANEGDEESLDLHDDGSVVLMWFWW